MLVFIANKNIIDMEQKKCVPRKKPNPKSVFIYSDILWSGAIFKIHFVRLIGLM